jgi:non-homologous end joining protein Ku
MPPLRTGLLSFGLVSIPVQLYAATQDQHIAFNLLHDKCGSRVQNRYYCPVCNEVVEREDRVRESWGNEIRELSSEQSILLRAGRRTS